MIELRFLSLRHERGGNIPIIVNGQVLDPSRIHVKLEGRYGHIRVKVPLSFYEEITGETEGQALAVVVLDNTKCNKTDISQSGSPPSSSWLRANKPPLLEEAVESLAEVGT